MGTVARVHVRRVDIDHSGIVRTLNKPLAQAYLRIKADHLNDIARRAFLIQSRGKSEAPEFYVTSFGIRRTRGITGIRGYQAYNSDDTAFWVEFGARAFGKYYVLRYRPYGKALASAGVIG